VSIALAVYQPWQMFAIEWVRGFWLGIKGLPARLQTDDILSIAQVSTEKWSPYFGLTVP
jgi:hypothetical protein